MSSTAQRIPSRHSGDWDRNHDTALWAVLPGTMSNRLVASNVDDRSAPNLGTPPALPPEQGLIDAHSFDGPDPIDVCFQQGFAPAANLFVHRMPPTTQLGGDLVDRTAPPAHLDGHPPRGPGPQQRPHRTKRGVLSNERPERTLAVRTRPAPFPPPQPHRPAERRQIHQHHRPIALRPHPTTTHLTHRTGLTGTDHHPQRCTLTPLVDPHQINLAQTYQQLAHTRRDQPPQDSSRLGCHISTADYRGPPITSGGFRLPLTDPRLPTHFRRALLEAVGNVCAGGVGDCRGWGLSPTVGSCDGFYRQIEEVNVEDVAVVTR